MATYYRKDISLQDVIGRAIASAQVYVTTQPSVNTAFPRILPSPLVTLFADTEGTPLTQPVVLDGQGSGFYYTTDVGPFTEYYAFQDKIRKILPDQSLGVASISSEIFSAIAGENINSFSAVTIHSDGNAYKASAATLADAGKIAGIATTSALLGAPITVQAEGLIDNSGGWFFTPGNFVYLGLSGAITETLGVGLFQQQLGVAKSAGKLLLNIEMPIIYA